MAKILPVSDLRNYNEVPCLLPNTSSNQRPADQILGSHPHFAVFAAQYFIQIASRGLDFGQPPSLCRACRPKLQIVVFDLVKAFIISFRIVFCDRYFPLQYIQVDECLQDEIERINEAIHRADGYGYNLHTVSHRYFIVEKFYPIDFRKSSKNPIQKSKFFNLTEMFHYKTMPDTAKIASDLDGRSWEEFQDMREIAV